MLDILILMRVRGADSILHQLTRLMSLTHHPSPVSISILSHHRYMDIPVISRLYFTGAFLTTAGCALDIISPFSLYFNFDLIFHQGQFWRLITTYLFFGMFSIDFLFHMYFLVSWECLLCIYWNVLFLI